jgi:DnaJ-class molecular chaperone
MENPYQVLGLNPNATNSEITKTYRDLAKQWHPDKNKSPEAAEMFKKINDCYKYLIDTSKREFFDTHGRRMDDEDEVHADMRARGNQFPQGFPFSQGFPFGSGGVHFSSGPNPEQIKDMKRKQLHIKMNIELSLEQIYTGIKKTLKYPRVRIVNNVQIQEEGEVELEIKPGFTSSSHIEIKNKGNILVENDGSEIIGSVIFAVSDSNNSIYERDYKKQENLICKRKI